MTPSPQDLELAKTVGKSIAARLIRMFCLREARKGLAGHPDLEIEKSPAFLLESAARYEAYLNGN